MHESPCEELPVVAEIGQQAVETGHSVCPMPGAELAYSSSLTRMAGSTTRLTYIRLDIAGLFKEETAWLLLPQNQSGPSFWKWATITADSNSVKNAVISKWIT